MNTPRARLFPAKSLSPVAQLKHDINQAIAWGTPDNESIGFTAAAFTALLVRAKTYITALEQKEAEGRAREQRLRSQLQALCDTAPKMSVSLHKHELEKARALLEELKS
jgi:uncharacterized protein involved in exopolysaccharide biosynthesis